MKTENDVWKPEVGDVVWRFLRRNGGHLKPFKVKSVDDHEPSEVWLYMENDPTQFPIRLVDVYPTAEAALASIKVYDLEGKEVVLTRDRVVEQVKAVSEDYIYECPVCQNLDGLANFCDNCGVQFGENPVGGYPHQHEVIVVDRRDNGC